MTARLAYMGTVRGFRRHALPELRRAAIRGWTITGNKRQIQQRLCRARLIETTPARRGPRGAA